MNRATSGRDQTADPDAVEIEGRFQAIESKVLYQERTVDELNTVVTAQQNQIDQLLAETKRLREVIDGGLDRGADEGEEPPPPHY